MGQAHEVNHVPRHKGRPEDEPLPRDLPDRSQGSAMEEPAEVDSQTRVEGVRYHAQDLRVAARFEIAQA